MAPDALKVTVSGMAVDVDARRGSRPSAESLEYSFDFDDGKPEAPAPAPTAHHDYAARQLHDPRRGQGPALGHQLDVKQKVTVR